MDILKPGMLKGYVELTRQAGGVPTLNPLGLPSRPNILGAVEFLRGPQSLRLSPLSVPLRAERCGLAVHAMFFYTYRFVHDIE